MTCPHTTTTDGTHYCYSGPVSVHPYTEENRRAHGCVTYTETCSACGARRDVNRNQCAVEVSPWGEPLATRLDRVRDLEALARAALATIRPLAVTKPGRTATVSLDSEAYLVVDGARWEEIERVVASSRWLDDAKAARRAVLAALCAREEIV